MPSMSVWGNGLSASYREQTQLLLVACVEGFAYIYSLVKDIWYQLLFYECDPGLLEMLRRHPSKKVMHIPLRTCDLYTHAPPGLSGLLLAYLKAPSFYPAFFVMYVSPRMSRRLWTARWHLSRKKLFWEGAHFLEITMALHLLMSNVTYHFSMSVNICTH